MTNSNEITKDNDSEKDLLALLEAEKVDYTSTQDPSDKAYNQAIDDCIVIVRQQVEALITEREEARDYAFKQMNEKTPLVQKIIELEAKLTAALREPSEGEILAVVSGSPDINSFPYAKRVITAFLKARRGE